MAHEQPYIDLIQRILNEGSMTDSRNGFTYSIFGHHMEFSLKNNIIPLLTTKRVAWKTCFRELMWFLRGSTNNEELKQKKVHIWDANGSREFLDSRGLQHREENDLGPVYGHQWRFFNAPYESCHTDYSGHGVDQIQYIIDALKDPKQHTSRRLVLSAWNPCQINEMALPPCHVLVQFYVRDHKYLSCSLYQRSGDVGLGVPFNIASYSFLTHLLAHHCGLEADKFVHFLGDAHIYEDHIDVLKEQIKRIPYEFPKMKFTKTRELIENYDENDIEWIEPYKHHSEMKMKMVA
uniref:thymidylate synthase n=1 Tax=viral metagenome TaxID=1070528 RepID=A0A6C0CLY6_9ZZZZ